MVDADLPVINADSPDDGGPSRRLVALVLVAVTFAVIALAAWIGLSDPGVKTLEEAAEAGDEVAVIQAFHAKWSEGDVAGALSFVDEPDQRYPDLRNIMEFVVAVEPESWAWSVRECTRQALGVYRCRVALVGDPAVDALALGADTAQFRVAGNRLTEVNLVDYREVDHRLALFAEGRDAAGYALACTEGDAHIVYNRTCGLYLSQYLADFTESLFQ